MTSPHSYDLYMAIDMGNSRVKIGLYERAQSIRAGENPAQTWRLSTANLAAGLMEIVRQLPPSAALKVGWTNSNKHIALADLEVWTHFTTQKPDFVAIDATYPYPIQNDYATPHSLGPDRMLGVIAARNLFPQSGVLVIDLGTALTYNFADAEGHFKGGAISLGLRMRFRALHEFTARLPLLDNQMPPDLIGNNTQNSMRSGVINGTAAEINSIVQQYKARFAFPIKTILTGGDATFLAAQLGEIDLVEEWLVIKGIALLMLQA